MRFRKEVWEDIEQEVGRRFRHTLRFYNKGPSTPTPASSLSPSYTRTQYMPLLRRFCHRYGIRLIAKTYAIGAKCLCSGGTTVGGRLTASFPISPLDIVSINPLMKHSGALSGDGFVPVGITANLTSLHILLPDAKAAFDAAYYSYSARALQQAMDLAQESASLYQRVVDSPMHLHVARCLDLMAAVLFDANQPAMAAANAERALALVFGSMCFPNCESSSLAFTTARNPRHGTRPGGVQSLSASPSVLSLRLRL